MVRSLIYRCLRRVRRLNQSFALECILYHLRLMDATCMLPFGSNGNEVRRSQAADTEKFTGAVAQREKVSVATSPPQRQVSAGAPGAARSSGNDHPIASRRGVFQTSQSHILPPGPSVSGQPNLDFALRNTRKRDSNPTSITGSVRQARQEGLIVSRNARQSSAGEFQNAPSAPKTCVPVSSWSNAASGRISNSRERSASTWETQRSRAVIATAKVIISRGLQFGVAAGHYSLRRKTPLISCMRCSMEQTSKWSAWRRFAKRTLKVNP